MTAKEKQKLKDAFLQCIENVLNALNVINHFNSFVSSTELNYQSLLQSFSVSKNLRLELQYLNCASNFIQFVWVWDWINQFAKAVQQVIIKTAFWWQVISREYVDSI